MPDRQLTCKGKLSVFSTHRKLGQFRVNRPHLGLNQAWKPSGSPQGRRAAKTWTRPHPGYEYDIISGHRRTQVKREVIKLVYSSLVFSNAWPLPQGAVDRGGSCGRKVSNLEKEPLDSPIWSNLLRIRWVAKPEMDLDWEGDGGLPAPVPSGAPVLEGQRITDKLRRHPCEDGAPCLTLIASLCDAFYLDQGQWLQDDWSTDNWLILQIAEWLCVLVNALPRPGQASTRLMSTTSLLATVRLK